MPRFRERWPVDADRGFVHGLELADRGPGRVRFNANGQALVVTHKVGSAFDVFRVGADRRVGAPVTSPASGPRPFALRFRNDGRLLAIESGLPTVNNAAVS